MSSLTQRMSLLGMVGKLFGGNRDLWKVFGYNKSLTYNDMVAKYRRQDIAARIIEAPADALWTNPPAITTKNTTWNTIWNDLVTHKNLWSVIRRADCMAGMGDFSALLIGFDKTVDLTQPTQLLPNRKVLYFQPYSYAASEVSSLVSDESNARYMKPEIYQFKPGMDPMERSNPRAVSSTIGSLRSFEAHYSRVLHIGENYLQDEVYGNPRLERVWNLLDDVLKVSGGTAETFWLTANRGMQIDVDKEMELTPDDEKDLTDEVEEYVHQLRRIIRTRGVKITNLGSDVPDPKNTFDILMAQISGATGIPKRILLGSEMGQLASTQDRNNWAERIGERRANFGEPVVVRPLIQLLTDAGVLPAVDAIEIVWPDPFKLSPLEAAQTSAQKARSAANLFKVLPAGNSLMDMEEARAIIGLTTQP